MNRIKILLASFFMLFATGAMAQDQKQLADEAMINGNYQQAISLYEKIAEEEESYSLYFNLGNAYYRTNKLGKAMLNYERARLLAPGNSDVRFNLQFVNEKTTDKIPLRSEPLFSIWYYSVVSWLTADGWAVLVIISAAMALILLLVYLFVGNIALQKTGFFGACFFIVLFLLSSLFAWQQSTRHTSPLRAIIMQKADVRKTPSMTTAPAFTLHEGTRVEITDTMQTWCEIKLDDNREGWIDRKFMEEI